MNYSPASRLATVVLCVGFVFPLNVFAEIGTQPYKSKSAANIPAVLDIAKVGGELQGSVVNAQGIGIADVEVVIWKNGRVQKIGLTDGIGRFSMQGISPGLYHLTAGDVTHLCRIWETHAAPPIATSEVLFVSGDVVRAQGQPGIANGVFGGGLNRVLSNPWAVGGVLAASIAVPVAVLDDEDAS